MNHIEDLVQLLQLKRIDDTTFEGMSEPIGSPNVFGGQVLAQAMYAATECTDPHKIAHSLHGYFLTHGKFDMPIRYNLKPLRNGKSFGVCRVEAEQNGEMIFIGAISFQIREDGYTHQMPMPAPHKLPEELLNWEEIYTKFKDVLPEDMARFLRVPRPVEFKPVRMPNPTMRVNSEPISQVWFRTKGDLDVANQAMQRAVLAYISDYNLLSTALLPHASLAHYGNTQMASLDHAIWFHADTDLSKWHLYVVDSPEASGARGLTNGKIFTEDGLLVASVAQEGLMRPIKGNLEKP